MKLVPYLFLFAFTVSSAIAQTTPALAPFILKGRLTNFKGGELIFFFRDPAKGLKDHTIETVKADSLGNFYLKTKAITQPVLATLRKENVSIDIYAAPGYELTFEGDVSDFQKFMLNKKITGKGAEANQFLLGRDRADFSYMGKKGWYELKKDSLVDYVKQHEQRYDSLYNSVFSKKVADIWFAQFAKISKLNYQFLEKYYLLNLATYDTTFTATSSLAFLAESGVDKKFWDNLYAAGNMVSENYTTWFMGTYAEFLVRQAKRKDRNFGKGKDEDVLLLEQVAANFKGPIREVRLYSKLNGMISYSRSFESFVKLQKDLPNYIALLKDPKDQKKLTELAATKESELMAAQVGHPAPPFTASDSAGTKFQLSDFKGRVVYLDLWASWCGPCRAETPHLKELIKKFSGNQDVAFISVAVHDKPDKWREALIKDTPTGLQLYDGDGAVQRSYFASSIPKFVLINKKGEIVSFDAPAPSSGKVVEELLEKEVKN